MMEQMAFAFLGGGDKEAPPPRPAGPALWVARLLILRAPSTEGDAIIRDIRLRRGLNILWAPPSPAGGENRLYEGTITGHTAGKTTFCRLLRYLLGEERFGSQRAQERIRALLPEGWIIGEVIVGGEPWIVGRPFARGVQRFASRATTVEAALEARAGRAAAPSSPRGEAYTDFLGAVTAAAVAHLPIKTLPFARRPVDWPLLLTWLARDQEARFAGVTSFRHPGSESASPNPKVADRNVILRAELDLMSDEEASLQEAYEALKERKRHLENEGVILRRRAEEDRRRLAERLGQSPDTGEAGPLFASHLRERVEAEREAVESAERALPERQADVERALEALLAVAARRALEEARLREAEGRASSPGEEAPQARALLDDAEAAHRACREEYGKQIADLLDERARLGHARASIEELTRLHGYATASRRDAVANAEARDDLSTNADDLSKRKASRHRMHEQALARLSDRFDEVVQALLGRRVRGRVAVSGGALELHILEQGEREGAAMETLKVLAFDLAALSLGIEGHGHAPGFLIHDGPREADMDEHIYERLFLYAEELERKTESEAPFQYIVTTTAAPPERLRRAPWLLDPVLDASIPERRLLGMDL